MPENNNSIISGNRIVSIAPIVVNNVKTGYYTVFVDSDRPFTAPIECRIKQNDLIHSLNELGFIVEEPTGNRKYKYLVPNIIGR